MNVRETWAFLSSALGKWAKNRAIIFHKINYRAYSNQKLEGWSQGPAANFVTFLPCYPSCPPTASITRDLT